MGQDADARGRDHGELPLLGRFADRRSRAECHLRTPWPPPDAAARLRGARPRRQRGEAAELRRGPHDPRRRRPEASRRRREGQPRLLHPPAESGGREVRAREAGDPRLPTRGLHSRRHRGYPEHHPEPVDRSGMRGEHGTERRQYAALRRLRERPQGHRPAAAGPRCRLQNPSGNQILSALHSVLSRQAGDYRVAAPALSHPSAAVHGGALAADSRGDDKRPSPGDRRAAQVRVSAAHLSALQGSVRRVRVRATVRH